MAALPITMPPTLHARAAGILDQYRQQDLDREGGPHLPPYGLQHTIRVFYPDSKHLQEGEELAEPIFKDFSSMYNPLDPLVGEVDSGRGHEGHDKLENNQFSTYYRATRYKSKKSVRKALFRDPILDLEVLTQAMTEHPGMSNVHLTPFRKKDDPPNDASLHLRIVIHNIADTTDTGLCATVMLEHVGPFVELYEFHCTLRHRTCFPWTQSMYDLINGTSTRAIRHRLIMRARQYKSIKDSTLRDEMKEKVEDDIEARYKFKRRRYPQYAMMCQNRRTNYLNIPEDQRRCGSCWEDFEPDSDKVALAYPCGNHYICEDCLVRTCEMLGSGPNEAKCGLDQTPMFEPWEREYLKYGDLNGEFSPTVPSRWEAWEDEHRAAFDLDEHSVFSNTLCTDGTYINQWEVLVRPGMFLSIWLDMLKLEDRYPEPDLYRPALFPELPDIVDALWQAVHAKRGQHINIPELHSYLHRAIEHQLMIRTCQGKGEVEGRGEFMFGLAQCRSLWYDNYKWISEPHQQQMQLYRDGMKSFIERSLNRTIMFMCLRLCRKPEHVLDSPDAPERLERLNEPWTQRNHMHGAREFHNDGVYSDTDGIWALPYSEVDCL